MPPQPLAGVLLLAHGCSHSATDFWPPSPGCAACLGLPEERRLVAAALADRLLAVAVSSADRQGSRCWQPSVDAPRVGAVLDKLLARLKVPRPTPLFALGASSGGAFVAALPRLIPRPVAAVVVQIMAADPARLLLGGDQGGGRGGGDGLLQQGPSASKLASTLAPYPPSLWIHMPRDERMAAGVAATVAGLSSAGRVAVALPVLPLAVADAFFSDRIPGIDAAASAAAVAALRAAGLLNSTGYLVDDPRRSGWRDALAPLARRLRGDTLEPDASAVAEELNVAWARHEITADFVQATSAFLRAHGGLAPARR